MSRHLTVPQVLSWRPEAFTAQAGDWKRQANEFRSNLDSQNRSVDRSPETFQGQAGDAMRDRFRQVYEKGRKVLEALEKGHDAAKIASLNFTTAKIVVQRTKDAAEAKGLAVSDDGTCTIREETKHAVYASVNGDDNKYVTAVAALQISADQQTAFVKQALDSAADADNQAEKAINAAFADLPTAHSFGNATTPKSEQKPPPDKGSPKENRAWWDSLTPQEQVAMISTQPASVGGLDGLPASVRDQANRNLLEIEKTRVDREIAVNEALVRSNPTSAHAQQVLEDSKKRRDDLAAVEKTIETQPRKPPRQLLVLDAQSGRQVRAAVAVGDPDTADHVSVTTPGLGTNVRDSLGGMVNEADQLKREAEVQLARAGRPDETVSTIAWIGYDPPQKTWSDFDIAAVSIPDRAEEGAPALAEFYEGLDTASTRNDPHITALGHSYGSLTTSLALQENGRAVDDVVFYGSPGLGENIPLPAVAELPITLTGANDAVSSSADLGLDRGHVYEMSEKDDPVANFHSFGRSPNQFEWVTHLSTDPITVPDGTPEGATYTGASGHAEYPRTDNSTGRLHRSGYNLAAILAGLPENATR
ncbi:alpha/beta hydrolase [Nocardia abscessus]|uniref:alpha/beta hydrolase n=1 Tax=Nocardia abscessus TaxID=120957 RepID=UPI002458106A|nr:alpha/beta hydrolase [Nocardia abscessus]